VFVGHTELVMGYAHGHAVYYKQVPVHNQYPSCEANRAADMKASM
jgi:hypothetical protein